MKNHKDHRGSSGEERQRWHEWGVSEVIGVVLLLALVVVGGTVVGTQLLSQPTPKEIPSVNFLANYEPGTLTLYHTGGDTLPNGDYKFVVQYGDGRTENFTRPDWSSGKSLTYPALSQPGKVTLIYTGNGAGETALRSVVIGDLGSDAEASTTTTTPTGIPTTVTTTPTGTVPTTETTIPTTITTAPTTTVPTTVPTTVITTPTVAPTILYHTINVTSGLYGQVQANEKTFVAGAPGSVSVVDDGQVNFTFTPTIGFHVADVGYTTDTGESGTFPVANNVYTLANVTRNYSVTASFAINTYTIRVTASQGGSVTAVTNQSGTVTIPPGTAGQQITVAYGEQPTFTFTPDVGSHTTGVAINGTGKGPIASYQFPPVVDNSNTVAATFSPNVYTVNVTSGLNGSVQANDQTVTAGTTGTVNVGYNGQVNFTYLPVTGHHVDIVTYTAEDGSQKQLPIVDNTSTLSGVKSNATVVANFAVDTFTITVTQPESGTITYNNALVTAPVTVNYNATPTFTFTPVIGYHLDTVMVDGSAKTPTGATYTFQPVTGPHTLTAKFAVNTFTINASAGSHGTINPNGTITVNYGDKKDFTITADTGYHITSVMVDSVSQTVPAGNTSYPYTFPTITSDHTINASFGINTYTINATAGEHGTITPSGTLTVDYGSSKTFTVTPATGYKIADVKVDDVSQGAITTYTFSSIQAAHTISASFEQIMYTITANTGPLGSITPSGSLSYAYHATPSFTVGSIPGYHIVNIIVDGVNKGTTPNYTFGPLEGDHTITADFAKNVYTITATAGAGGSITPSGNVHVDFGDNLALIITPNSGYDIDDVVVDGISMGEVNSFTFTQVNGNHTIQAFFDTSTVGPYSISGYIWNDQNNNGVWDSGEPPLAGWTVQAQGKGHAQDWYVVNQSTSDSTGYYIIDNLPKDHYHVVEVQHPGWDQTWPTKHEGYYIDNLNQGRDDKHQHVTDRNFGNHMTTTTGNQILLNNPMNIGVLKDGTYIRFTGATWREWPQPAHTDDWIKMDSSATLVPGLDIVSGKTFRIPWQTEVTIMMDGDQANGQIYISNTQISTYQFDHVKVYFNGNLVATGKITEIWVNGYTNWQSTLTYVMGSYNSGAQFVVNGTNVINPPWWPYQDWGVNVYGISPQNPPYSSVLNFNYQNGRTYLVCSGTYDMFTA